MTDIDHDLNADAGLTGSEPSEGDFALTAEQGDEPLAVCPDNVPEKFWDKDRGEVRVDVLLKSYGELEKKLGGNLSIPGEDDPEGMDKLLTAMGRPETADAYQIEPSHPDLEVDSDLNERLFDAGFSQKQAQMVYDLAAEYLMPAISEMNDEWQFSQTQEKLSQHFGGNERWQAVAKQIEEWGTSRFDEDTFATLTSTYEGVLALAEMMKKHEPAITGQSGPGTGPLSEEQLNAMIADPRYWQKRDPEFIEQVTKGFSTLYGR